MKSPIGITFLLQNQRIFKTFCWCYIFNNRVKRKVLALSVKVLSQYNNKWVNASSFIDRRLGLTILRFCKTCFCNIFSLCKHETFLAKCLWLCLLKLHFQTCYIFKCFTLRKNDYEHTQRDFKLLQKTSSHQRCSIKEDTLGNFAKFTEKYLRQSLFLNKIAGLKRRLWHRCFPVDVAKFLRTPFYRTPPGDCF